MSQKPKILLVDDVPTNLYALSRALAEEYEIFVTTSGQHALQLAREHHPDLILLDVMMPEMDGFQVLKQLRDSSWGRDIPVILITGDDRPETQVAGLEQGAEDFITKPVIVPVVRTRVHNVLERRRMWRELVRLATTDELTGVLNRRRFFELGEAERLRITRYGYPCGVLMLDLDHFKRINDRYGHAAGDKVLQIFAATIGDLLRNSDILGRIGGEEFAVILPQTDHAGALGLAERLRASVAARTITIDEGELSITTSIGVTQLTAHDERFDRALLRADDALYRAKAEGRNCVRALEYP